MVFTLLSQFQLLFASLEQLSINETSPQRCRLWNETRSRGPGFGDFKTNLLEDVPVLIEVGTEEYEMLDCFITI
jgi:hypothetical protein